MIELNKRYICVHGQLYLTNHISSRHARFQEQDLRLYRSFEIGNLAFTGQDSVQTPFNKTHAKPMSLFLHLKYTNH